MKKILFFLLLLCTAAPYLSLAQDTSKVILTPEQSRDLMNQIFPDTMKFLHQSGNAACHCIDSLYTAEKKNKEKIMAGIPDCIDKEAEGYQMAVKLLHSMKNPGKKNEINVSIDKEGPEYKKYYYDIERWLKDSCAIMNAVINDEQNTSDNSFSSNKEAVDAYNKGLPSFNNEDYATALPYFKRAVTIDSVFAFAWDNLAVCYRHTNQYEKAEAAYKTSLRMDSTGHTPLQNLPVLYQLMGKTDDAISAYNDFLKFYPGDPEVYYGLGLLYFSNKKDNEKALETMCKAYNIYATQKSPFRADAEKVINMIYGEMKKANKEDVFKRILKENNISTQ